MASRPSCYGLVWAWPKVYLRKSHSDSSAFVHVYILSLLYMVIGCAIGKGVRKAMCVSRAD